MVTPTKDYLLKFLFIIFCICFLVQNVRSQNWDVDILRNINPNPPSSKVWKGFSATAEPISLSIPIGLFTVALLENNKSLKEQSIEVMGSLVLASIATEGLKIIVDRKRPYERYTDIYPYQYETGKSFPSGHAALAFSTATSLSIQFKKWYIIAPCLLMGNKCFF
jgi:membrane-associated phospholipid phosphatase